MAASQPVTIFLTTPNSRSDGKSAVQLPRIALSGGKPQERDMGADTLQTWSQIVVAIGIVVTALGGLGSYYYGKKADDVREQARRTAFGELLTRSETLEESLKPFQELARTAHPDLDQQAALDSLRQDLERLRDIAGKHEFTPLAPELRAAFVRDVQAFAPSFLRADIFIQITHETWSPPATQQYAAQLASLLREGGLQVQGPDQITYFLVTPASPIEWGYHDRDIPHIEVLYQALLKVIRPNTKWTKASHQEHGSIRIHFGGQVVFEPNGMVAVL